MKNVLLILLALMMSTVLYASEKSLYNFSNVLLIAF